MNNLNIFVNSTTYGQAIGCTFFDLALEGQLSQKNLTPIELCEPLAPVYERVIETEKIANLLATGQTKKVTALGKAIETENVRVNSLAVLIRELTMVVSMEDSTGAIIAYIPEELLREIESGRIKFYLNDENSETTYYSEQELTMWTEALELIQLLYCRLVFKNINACKNNVSDTPVQADRVKVYSSMYNKMLIAFRAMKASKTGAVAPLTGTDSAF